MEIKGKAAVVTGASRGVGQATAIELATQGCDLVLVHRNSESDAEATAQQARALGVQAFVVQADVSQDQDCRRIADTAQQQIGHLEIVVNNAGTTKFIHHHDVESVCVDDWHRMMDVNVMGPFQVFRACLPLLQAADSAEVVNVASIAGLTFPGSSIPYGASKAALINLTLSLARAFGPDQIRVNAIAPGFIDGQWLQQGLGERFSEIKQAVVQSNPLQAVCQPADVAAAILSVIQGSDLMTGATLTVDGGQILGSPVL
ncbi:Glucose 1-dehydrogenase 2 [Stieleria bergensis]|uniref:Glucose 1-dehydrogenase 2 n=1 Tax=Stieleria bergensis TaxID=2528025 RepID=A0A517SSA6_9BACT|nr:Glucose 1-dehydrogenase 2 [Planctomycetes bacterium SV_7m_r]